ncbi:MAG TPA: ABC transporter permease subunit, partial [Acidimicrobiales bacterium]|nr:ABC transporter permease subunit [Acidimicrobiales bacterium]
MSALRPFVGPDATLQSRSRVAADALVLIAVAVGLWLLVNVAHGINAPFDPAHAPTAVSTDPSTLPYAALRSLTRMFVALAVSVLFTFVYATAAARSRRAEKVLVPLLDVLQSVPVLGFLSITLTMWLTLFPNTMLGLECASIFAIFTSQVWNLTFAFYESLTTQPRELDEAARVLRMTKWQRFWKLDVPGGMIPLVWNGMMSFGGGWFFLVASEVISVNNHTYALPGIGSYVAAAAQRTEVGHMVLAIAVMVVMIVVVNVAFWRPLTAWAERFRSGDTTAQLQQRSLVLDLLRHSAVPGVLGRIFAPVGRGLDRVTRPLGLAEPSLGMNTSRRRAGDAVFTVVLVVVVAIGAGRMLGFVDDTVGLGEFGH